MSGFENDVMLSKNVNFNNTGPKPHLGIITSNGQLLIGATTAPFIRANNLTSSDNSVTITNGPGTIDLKVNPSGEVSFLSELSTTQSNVTGDGTAFTIVFDNVVYNNSGSYNNSTGIFTAPEDGVYLFTSTINFTGCSSANDSYHVDLLWNSVLFHGNTGGAFGSADAAGSLSAVVNLVVRLSQNDTIKIQGDVNGNASKNVSIIAAAFPTIIQNYFSGFLLF